MPENKKYPVIYVIIAIYDAKISDEKVIEMALNTDFENEDDVKKISCELANLRMEVWKKLFGQDLFYLHRFI